MKNLTLIIIAILCIGCKNSDRQTDKTPKQTYVLVDAKVRVYHKDGTRTYNDYKTFKTRTIGVLPNYTQSEKEINLSIYGGSIDNPTDDITGFFHVKKIGNRWWCIDPLGYKYFNIALNSINTGKSEKSKVSMKNIFGSKENWMKETIHLLQENGFNCAGSWSDTNAIIEFNKISDKQMPYTINWNFMSSYGRKRGGTHQQAGHTGYPKNAIFVFDPDFTTFCDEHAKKILKYKDDPNLFGHFSDNEMPFKFEALDNYLSLSETDHGRIEAEKWLKERNILRDQIKDEDRALFMAYVGETYFSIVSKAIKKYDPNHMYIGSRFYSREKHTKEFMMSIGQHLDVISNNYYNHWTPDSEHLKSWTEWTGKPFIVTEYYTKGEDSGMGNTSGAGWIVRTQKDRGLFYQNYNLALLESKNCVGWHYFKYQDNDPTAKGVDPSNIDANKGIVTSDYKIWTPMMEKMKELNTHVYSLIDYFDNEKK